MTSKAARDLKVGDTINYNAEVTTIDTTTTPGVVYVWINGNTNPCADLIYNHGDPVKTVVKFKKISDVKTTYDEIFDEDVEDEDEDPEPMSWERAMWIKHAPVERPGLEAWGINK